MASRITKTQLTKPTGNRKAQSAPQRTKSTQHPKGKPTTLHVAKKRPISCSSCARSFSTQAELLQHKRDKHDTKPQSGDKFVNLQHGATKFSSKKFSCSLCTRSFSTNHELVQHQRDKHRAEQPNGASHLNMVHTTVNKTDAGKLSCPFCERKFSSDNELSQHKRDKHKVEQPCAKSFFRASKVKDGVNCQFCSRSFSTRNELSQHQNDKHQINTAKVRPATAVPCQEIKTHIGKHNCTLCYKSFTAQNELLQHIRDKHTRPTHPVTFPARASSSGASVCLTCAKSFPTAAELEHHKKNKHVTPGPVYVCSDISDKSFKPDVKNILCSVCSSRFSTVTALSQHMKDKHASIQDGSLPKSTAGKKKTYSKEYKCPKCAKGFPTNSQLVQHQSDKHRTNEQVRNTPRAVKRKHSAATDNEKPDELTKQQKVEYLRNKRKKTIDEYYEKKVNIDKDEKKESVQLVNDTLFKIMSHVHSQKGGDIYCQNHVKAGSFPVNTKIGKPDEFDTNICLKVRQKDVKVSWDKKINYAYAPTEHATNMNVKCDLDKAKQGVKVPDSYAVASVVGDKIPEDLRHGNDVVPRKIRVDLYQKIKTAINELKLTHVDLSRNAHGPALTMTIRPRKHHSIQHHISVDVTLSLPCDVPIKEWPRRATKQAFSVKLINDVKETGTHLVPKKDEFWAVSYSKAERVLFSSLDEGNGCRKFVYKMLKKYMQNCKSRSQSGLQGLSSHILKTQLLWSCERHTEPAYWHHINRDVCLVDALADLENTLKKKHLPDYFDTKNDILKSKDSDVCLELANYLHDKRCGLEQQ